MWDDTLIESRQRTKRNWTTVVFSVSLHFCVVAVLIAASFWYLEAVEPRGQAIYHAPVLPAGDPIPVALRRGTPKGDNRTGKSEPVTQISQETIHSGPELDLNESHASTPFELSAIESDGAGPLGDPNGTSTEGGMDGGDGGAPIIITPEVEPPVLLERVQPDYPESMIRAGVQGAVILSAIIDRAGGVEVKEVLRSVHPILDRSAIRAVNQWKYRPASINGRPVTVWFTVTVSYQIR